MMIRQCMNNKYLYLCYITLLLAGLLSTGHGFFFGANSCDRDENSKYQSLYCWLSKEWRIHIPDVSIKEFIFTMSLTGMVCHDLKIASIQSSLEANNTMKFAFPKSMEVSCDGHYQMGIWSGDLSVKVKHGVEMDVQFVPSFQIPQCNAQEVEASSVDFSGSLSADIIEWFHTSIKNHVTSALHQKLCPSLQQKFPKAVQSQLISPIQSYIHQLIQNATQPDNNLHPTTANSVTWERDLPGLQSLLNTFQSSIVDTFLNKGILLNLFPGLAKLKAHCGYFYNGFQGDWFPQLLLETFYPDGKIFNVSTDITIENATALQNLTLFQPSSPSAINLASIKYPEGMNVSIQVKNDDGTLDPFTLTLSMNHVELVKSILSFASLNRTVFDSTTLSNILSPKNFQFTDIDVNVSLASINIDTHESDPSGTSLDQDVDKILMTLCNDILLPNYSPLFSKIMWAYMQGNARRKMNQIISQPFDVMTTTENVGAAPILYKSLSSFGESFKRSLECRFHVLERYFNHNLMHGKPMKIIGPWNLKSFEFLQVPSLDSIEFFEPVDDGHFENGLRLAHNKEAKMLLEISNDQDTAKNFIIHFNLSDVVLFLGNGFDYNTTMLQEYRLSSILNDPLKLIVPLQSAGVYGLSKNDPGNFDFKIDFSGFENKNINSFVQSVQRKLVDGFPHGQTGTQELDEGWQFSIKTIQDLINGYLKINLYQLYESETSGENNKSKVAAQTKDENNLLFFNGIILISVYFCANIIFLSIQFCKKRSEDEPPREIYDEPSPSQRELRKTTFPKNLMFAPKTKPSIRYLIPALIFCTIFLFLVSITAPGAVLSVGATAPPHQVFGPFTILNFTLILTLEKMWNNGLYTLFFIIFIFSLIWPYVKLILMLVAWTVPERWFSLEQREELLFWLDALGKFSLVDIFALVVFMAVFRFHFPVMSVNVATYIIPEFGFNCFLYATVSSLIIGHAATYVNRLNIRPTIKSYSKQKYSIRTHLFQGNTEGSYKKLSKLFQVALGLGIVLDIVLLSFGIFKSIYVFHLGGLPGAFLGFPANRKEVSVWTFGLAISRAVSDPNEISVRLIQAIFMFFAVIMPFAVVVVSAVLFLVPLSVKAQERVFALAEICNAWSSIEVFLLASLICTLQIPKMVESIRKKNCGAAEKIFQKFDFKDIFGTDKCLDIRAHMKSDAITLYIAVGVHIFLMYLFLKLSHRVLHDRIEREFQSEESDRLNKEVKAKHDSKRFFERFSNSCLGKVFFVEYTPPVEEPTETEPLVQNP